jgi:hypothetical protein
MSEVRQSKRKKLSESRTGNRKKLSKSEKRMQEG